MASGASPTEMVKLQVALWVGAPESDTWKVRPKLPAVEGVPAIRPLAPSARPGGSAPEAMLHAYGRVPPVAASVVSYATPTVPAGRVLVAMPSGGGGCVEVDPSAQNSKKLSDHPVPSPTLLVSMRMNLACALKASLPSTTGELWDGV